VIKMKVRNGFVSNSSSSSFIISKDAYEDVFDLAKVMICHRGHDDSGDFYVESNKKLCEILNDEKSRGRDPNIGVTFPSCNSLMVFFISVVTVPVFGLGINPLGPKILAI